MTPGELFYWPQHKFDDGGTSDKLLIILNTQRNGVHLAAYTTSQGVKRGWSEEEGCMAEDEIYFIREGTNGFISPTWVQLYRLQEYEVDRLENQVISGRIKSLRQLSDNLRRAIVNCYKRTDSFSEYHGWLLEEP